MLDEINNLPEESLKTPTFIEKYRRYFLPTLIALAVIVAGALVAVFFDDRGDGGGFEGDARLTINVPNQSVSGSEVSFEILIENVSNTALSQIGLDLFYPDGFEYIDHSRIPTDSERISTDNIRENPSENQRESADHEAPRFLELSDLAPGREHRIIIVGTLSGSVQEVKTLNARLRYVPENFRSTFEAEARASVVMLAPNLTLRLRGPSQIYAGQTGRYEVEITNRSDEIFRGVVVRLEDNPNFEFVESNPPAVADNVILEPHGVILERSDRISNEKDSIGSSSLQNDREVEILSSALGGLQNDNGVLWVIPQINPGQKIVITFSGRLAQTLSGEVLLQVEQFLPAPPQGSPAGPDVDGTLLSAGRSFVFTSVLAPPLRLTFDIQHRSAGFGGGRYPEEGDNLDIQVGYEHQGLTALENVSIILDFEGDVLDYAKLRNTEGAGQRSGNAIVWIPGANPQLRLISPGNRGSYRLTIPVISDLASGGARNPLIKGKLSYRSDEFPEEVEGAAFEKKVATEIGFGVSKTVISETGASTRYLVEFSVDSSVNDATASVVSAAFPGLDTFVDFDSASPASEKAGFAIESSAGIIRWDLGTLAAGSVRRLSFELTSSAPVLLSDIVFSGTDVFTGEGITISANELRK